MTRFTIQRHLMLASLMLVVALTRAADPPADATSAGRMESLMAQLGDEEFAARERATEQLIRLGLDALPALENGLRQPDREVRYRSERILLIVREVDFRRRLEAFLNDPEGKDGFGLPSWELYRERLGDSSEARHLFVDMQRAEPELMSALDTDGKGASMNVVTRCHELTRGLSHPTDRREPSIGSIAALLFAAGDEDVILDQNTSAYLYQFCYQNQFRVAIAGGAQSDLLRMLLAAWIRRGDDATSYQGMVLAVQYGLKEGLEPAIKTLGNPQAAPLHVRLYAMLAVVKLGDEKQLDLIEQQLDDKMVYGGNQKINNVEYQTQMRDIALASLWYLAKEDPSKHGFDHIQPNPQTVFNTSTVGFATDASRDKALQEWRDYRAAQKANEPVPDQGKEEPSK